MLTPVTLWLVGHMLFVLKQNKRLTWDMHCEYIDLSEFSNRNIPLKISYKGTEPKWLWVAYVSLHNTGRVEIRATAGQTLLRVAEPSANSWWIALVRR